MDKGGHQLAPPGGVQLEGVAAQPVSAFHQVHFITLLRQGQGGGHARDPATDDQGLFVDPHGEVGQRLQQPGLGHRHVHQVPALGRGRLRLVLMHPGALVADVGHLEEILVEAGVAQHILEDGLVGGGAAGRHHHPVQVVLLDHLDHLVLGVFGAGKEIVLGVSDIGNDRAYSTMAGTSATPPILMPQLQTKTPTRGGSSGTSCSGGKFLLFQQGVPGRGQGSGGRGRGGAALPSPTGGYPWDR